MTKRTVIVALLIAWGFVAGCDNRDMEAYCNATGQGTPEQCHEWWGGP